MIVSRNIIYTLVFLLGILALISNANGVPQAVTKAPGESGFTCNVCHTSAGNFAATIGLEVMNKDSLLMTSYIPGEEYILRIKVSGTNNPKSYGFQMSSLVNANNSDAGKWSNFGPKVKQQTLLNRKYVVQSNPQSSGIFTVNWTAPTEDKGDIKFYLAGLAVNLDGRDTGDNHANTTLTLPAEINISSTSNYSPSNDIKIYPTVASELLIIEGKNIHQASVYSTSGKELLTYPLLDNTLDISNLATGTYFLILKDVQGKGLGNKKFIKI